MAEFISEHAVETSSAEIKIHKHTSMCPMHPDIWISKRSLLGIGPNETRHCPRCAEAVQSMVFKETRIIIYGENDIYEGHTITNEKNEYVRHGHGESHGIVYVPIRVSTIHFENIAFKRCFNFITIFILCCSHCSIHWSFFFISLYCRHTSVLEWCHLHRKL